MEKTLSIIIPTYNMEKYLQKCLDSFMVSDENMKLLEVLIINDGSKDSSSQIAHEYESKYPDTFRVIDKENGNYGSCINRGLKEATGKYVKVLDADDYYDVAVCNRFVDFLNNKDVDLVINEYCIFDENDNITESYSFNLPIDREFGLDEFPDFMSTWLWHHGITYRTQILRDMKYQQTEGISYTDDEWIFKPMVHVKSILYFPERLYYYLRGREGQTFDPKVLKKSLGNKIVVARSMLEYYIKTTSNETVQMPRYCYLKLKQRLTVLYNFIITKQYAEECNTMLAELDKVMMNLAPRLYNDLNTASNRLGQNYIYNWRKNGYMSSKRLLRLYKIGTRLSSLLHLKDNSLKMPESYKRRCL